MWGDMVEAFAYVRGRPRVRVVLLCSTVVGLFGAPWGGHLAARRGARTAATLGSLLIFAGWCGLTLSHNAVWLLTLWAMVTSLGGAMMMSAVPNLLVEVVPAERTKILSTSGMVTAAEKTTAKKVLVATETGMLHQLRKANPLVIFEPVRSFFQRGSRASNNGERASSSGA